MPLPHSSLYDNIIVMYESKKHSENPIKASRLHQNKRRNAE